IRDRNVTGVQTCALPILGVGRAYSTRAREVLRPPFLDPKAKDKHMDKKQQGCLVYVVALFIYLLLGWVVVKAGIQPVAEALGYRSEERRVGEGGGRRWEA